MKKLITAALLFSLANSVIAQDPGALLNLWAKRTPIEKVFLHIDREQYAAGETIWFKAYLYADNLPDTISTVLYAELCDNQSRVVSRKVLPVILGNTNGHFDLPDSLGSGTYMLRAYSPTMLNHHHDLVYARFITIHGKGVGSAGSSGREIQLTFFPEGGNLVAGVNNSLAFKANDPYGLPVNVSGSVRNSKQEKVAAFSVYHDGMGLTEFTPARGERYHAVIDNDPSAKQFVLPGVSEKGIAVSIVPHPSGFFFDVRQQAMDGSQRVSFMLGQMQHHVVFRQNFKQDAEVLEGLIDTRNLSSGIMQVTFFNSQGLPLAERLCFVNNGEYVQHATLAADTLDFGSRSRNRFSILMKDTIQGNFSISVTDADYSGNWEMDEHIASRLLLQADLPGYIHNPGYYFSAKSDSVTTATDLLMMTNGWRRFNWTTLAHQSTLPLAYSDPGYITLSGKVTLRDSKKTLAEKPIFVFISAGDTARKFESVVTDKQGYFKIDSLLFFGRAKVLYSDSRGKQNYYIDVTPAADSLTRKFSLQPVNHVPQLFGASAEEKWKQQYDEIMKANGLLLEGITLKVRKKTPSEMINEEYTTGAFSGEARKSFDLVNSDDGENYTNVFSFLEAKGFLPNRRNLPTISAMGEIQTNVYLDEMPVDIDLELIPMYKVALIKVFNSFVGEWGAGPGGVIAIYTRKGEHMTTGAMRGALVNYPGFSIVKEFYAPNYKRSEQPAGDTRITLDWRPDIFINSINPRIPFSFYNNDRTKRFRVNIQGMTADGKMVFIDQVLEPRSKGF